LLLKVGEGGEIRECGDGDFWSGGCQGARKETIMWNEQN
jgi:hypothetical protein